VFFLNPEKKGLVVFEKNAQTAEIRRTPIPKKWRHRAEG